MYSYIIGEFVEMTPEGIVIENNGIGYDIKTSSLTAENIPKSGEFVKPSNTVRSPSTIRPILGEKTA